MSWAIVTRNRVLVVGLAVVVGGSVAYTASAVTPAANDIHACVANKGGAVRIAKKCRKSETALTWSQTGPAGAVGATGAQGPAGPTGDKGEPGAKGTTGAQGVEGLQGPAGTTASGLKAYASFSNDSGSAYNVTIGGVSIDFFDTAVANNIKMTTPIATLPQAGVYRFSYCIRTTANSSASSRLVINGSAINASIITPVTQTDVRCRTTMLSLISTNSTVQVQLFGTLAPVTLIAPGGADLQIEKLN